MSNTPFRFDRGKAIEVIIYLSKRITNPNCLSICKLLYLADKTSLETSGRFIFGDDYLAMGKGPVPSRAYDLMKAADEKTEYGFVNDGYHIDVLREAELDWLSESDTECLDQIIEMYGAVPNRKIADDSRDDVWKAAWEMRENQQSVPMALEKIIGIFDGSEDLHQYIFCRD